MHRENKISSMIAAAGLALSAAGLASAQTVQVLYFEGFESAVLEDAVNESSGNKQIPFENVWTDTPPAGWVIDDSGVPFLGDPAQGVEEWEGWSFATIDFWNTASGQTRGDFSSIASGTVAIADGDEWDDLGNPEAGGPMVTLLTTPAVNISADAGGLMNLNFASSWRFEEPQIVWIDVSFNGGAPVRVLEWTWDDSQTAVPAGGAGNQIGFKGDHVENQSLAIAVPPGATSVQATFGYSGVNDWWWAIDNVQITGPNSGAVFFEDFEGLALEDSVDELQTVPFFAPDVWTDSFAGWTFDDSQMPGLGDPARGVEEWEGYAIANGVWWNTVAGDQDRSNFVVDPGHYGQGNVLIADPDEWDDLGSATDFAAGNYFNAIVESPEFSISGAIAGTMALNFASSWRDEAFDDGAETNNQTAVIEVSFDGGAYTEVLRWNSDSTDTPVGPGGAGNQFGFKNDAQNEFVVLPLVNPANASTMQIRFSLLNAGNDWWWAIDNIYVSADSLSAPTNAPAPFFCSVPSHNATTTPTVTYGTLAEGLDPSQVVPGAEEFEIVVADDADFTEIVFTGTSTEASYTFPGGALQSGVYFLKVVASNGAGSRDSNNTVQFAVSNNCSNADFNADGLFDLSDITAFVSGFQAPCGN